MPNLQDLASPDEAPFQEWYKGHAQKQGLAANPDDPLHFYDYRGAYRAGASPDPSGHWPSKFKREGHPNLIVEGRDTRTGKPMAPSPQGLRGLASGFAPPPSGQGMSAPSLMDLLQGGKGKLAELYQNPEIQKILQFLGEEGQPLMDTMHQMGPGAMEPAMDFMTGTRFGQRP